MNRCNQPAPPPPAAFDPFTPEALAAAPPPRRLYRVPHAPTLPYLERAMDRQPGDRPGTGRQVFVCARLFASGERPGERLTAACFFDGPDWPAPARLAVFLHCPAALWLERRLAALAARPPVHVEPEG